MPSWRWGMILGGASIDGGGDGGWVARLLLLLLPDVWK